MDENEMTLREESSQEPATIEEYETGLPPFLQHDLDAYKEVLRTNSKYLDCLWGELYPKNLHTSRGDRASKSRAQQAPE